MWSITGRFSTVYWARAKQGLMKLPSSILEFCISRPKRTISIFRYTAQADEQIPTVFVKWGNSVRPRMLGFIVPGDPPWHSILYHSLSLNTPILLLETTAHAWIILICYLETVHGIWCLWHDCQSKSRYSGDQPDEIQGRDLLAARSRTWTDSRLMKFNISSLQKMTIIHPRIEEHYLGLPRPILRHSSRTPCGVSY